MEGEQNTSFEENATSLSMVEFVLKQIIKVYQKQKQINSVIFTPLLSVPLQALSW